ncbi:13844_t:CDS:2, partial [Cetraspora pellucida]
MGNKRKKYVDRACTWCKERKFKCQKDNGPTCEACIKKGQECVTPESTNKRGPKPRLLATARSNEPSKKQKNEHPQSLPRLNENSLDYQSFLQKRLIEDVMINGDKGGDYEGVQTLQLSETTQNEAISYDCSESTVFPQLSESIMINGDSSHFNIDLNYWLSENIRNVTESVIYKSPMLQNDFKQMPKNHTTFFPNQKQTSQASEVIQNDLLKDREKEEHDDIVQYWNNSWAGYLKKIGNQTGLEISVRDPSGQTTFPTGYPKLKQ